MLTLPDFLVRNADGYIHFTGHRVGLVDVVGYYQMGDSVETLDSKFPTIPLAWLHKAITFLLANETEVLEYCAQ